MDGSTALEFVQTTDGYKTTETVGALTITTNYNTAFEKVGTSIERKYEDVKALDAMSSKFQSAWSDVQSYLPSAFKNSNSPVQFATEKNQIIVISTVTASGTNGDVIGRITQRSNEGNENSWQRWFGDQAVTVKTWIGDLIFMMKIGTKLLNQAVMKSRSMRVRGTKLMRWVHG